MGDNNCKAVKDVCADCPAVSRETGICEEWKTCVVFQQARINEREINRKARLTFIMHCEAI